MRHFAIAAAVLALAGCAAAPPPVSGPQPGQPFLPVWMDELRHPLPQPVCEPRDLSELMLGCHDVTRRT